jgi:transposase
MLDLYTASREELIRIIVVQREMLAAQTALLARQQQQLVAQQAVNADLVQRVGALAAANRQLAQQVRALEGHPDKPRGLAGNKLIPDKPATPKRPRKQRRHNAARRRMTPPAQVIHAVNTCPDCGQPLSGGHIKRTREVIELVFAPVTVTEHVYVQRRCAHCRQRWMPPRALDGLVVGQQRLGIGLVSLIATLREAGRWPVATIQWYLATLHQLHLSVGALVNARNQVVARGQGWLTQLRDQLRASPVVHADETGWREDGTNGYVGTFCTPTVRYFVRRSRRKAVVDEVLGDTFSGVLVSDFYGAYDHYPGVKQRCWAHLVRDLHDLCERHPADDDVRAWTASGQDIYRRAKDCRATEPAARRRAQRRYEQLLLACCHPYLAGTAPQAVLCRRIADHLAELFVFVVDPAVPSTNNAAERSLRHLVTGRKISGGTRSNEGSATRMALASFFGTWRATSRNPFLACGQLLAHPTPSAIGP